jgi:hypothetical protein
MPKDILDIYTDYLICQNQHATVIVLTNLLDFELSLDQITRFLNKNEYDSKDL